MIQPSDATTFRFATVLDAAAVAHLHASSWRAHYRGALTDAFLDGPVDAERLAVWTERLGSPQAGTIILLAEQAGMLVGFVCAFADEDARFGTLIDNLHVVLERKAAGHGRALMREMAGCLAEEAPHRPVHLFVKEMNKGARAFYARIGGVPAGNEVHDAPDGSQSRVTRIVWASPAALLDATTSC